MRATRHADFVTVDLAIGTPFRQLTHLLKMDVFNGTSKNMRLFSQQAVESSTVSCNTAGLCSDVLMTQTGPFGDHTASVVELSPLSLSTIVTLSGSHVIAGAAAAMSSLGSAVGIAMMVGGRGAPLLAAWLGPDWMRTPGWAPSCSDEGSSHVGQAHALP